MRWTEQRNFEAVLDAMAAGDLDTQALLTHGFDVTQAEAAYAVVAGSEPSLGIVLRYPDSAASANSRTLALSATVLASGGARRRAASGVPVTLGAIGAGNYANAVLIPAFAGTGARLSTVVSSGGVSSAHVGKRFGFARASTDTAAVLDDADTGAVIVSTRHDTHARFVVQALDRGKHVFVEKPLCLTREELAAIEDAVRAAGDRILMVGYNRRFAPQVKRVSELLASRPGPRAFVYTVNAGAIPADHWTQNPTIGGGRLLGEACHFIDLLRHLAGAPIAEARVSTMSGDSGDTFSISLAFLDGSIGTIHYLANGSKAFPKERLEVFAGGGILQLDNYRVLRGYGWPGFRFQRLLRQDKGQNACAKAFVLAIEAGGASPIPIEQVLEVARVSIDLAAQSRRSIA